MDFAERLCDHIALIEKGKLILQGSLSEIKSRFAKNNILVSCEDDIMFMKDLGIADSIIDNGNEKIIKLKDGAEPQELLRQLVQRNIKIKKYAADEISLHEIFIEATGEDRRLNTEGANV